MDIKNLIQERIEYSLGVTTSKWKDELLGHIVENVEDEQIEFITIASSIITPKNIEMIRSKYNIVGIYKLGNIFTNTSIPFYIVQLDKIPSTGLKISLFNGDCYHRTGNLKAKGTEFSIPNSYTDEWNEYIGLLENWTNGGDLPSDADLYEFDYIPNEKLMDGRLLPDTYSKEARELREIINRQDTIPLSDVADIVSPHMDRKSEDKVKVLRPKDLVYPLDVSAIEKDIPTSVLLQYGDIIIPKIKTKTVAYLFNYDGSERIYASHHFAVIKCRKILPEYLYLYLNSDIAIKVMNAISVGSIIQRISLKEIEKLPIALPTQEDEKYISDFNTLTHFGIRDYSQLQELNEYYEHLDKIRAKEEKADAVEDILNMELADDIKAYKEDQLRTFLTDDLKELNTCFRNKAYKATLILAGSILEAVLIDWLSEIHHTNYFEEDYFITDRNGREKRADLIDYINEIKYLRRPRWVDEATKAHAIRKKRNLVHAKLCMHTSEINEDVCREVISYLRDVLKTRGIYDNKKN